MSKVFSTLLTLAVAGCAVVEPFVDRRREAGAEDEAHLYVGESTPEKPVVCYNPLVSDYPAVKELADAECVKYGTGIAAEPFEQKAFDCRLLVPSRIYFQCTNKAAAQ